VRGADAREAFELSGFDLINTAGHAGTIDLVDLGALRNEPTAPICTRSSARSTGGANVAQMLVTDEVKDPRRSAPTAKRGTSQCQR
jgi:hypothetical protein